MKTNQLKPMMWMYMDYLIETRPTSMKIGSREHYAIIQDGGRGSVLNNMGEWEVEPLPSNRDDEYYARCRYETIGDAIRIINKVRGVEEIPYPLSNDAGVTMVMKDMLIDMQNTLIEELNREIDELQEKEQGNET